MSFSSEVLGYFRDHAVDPAVAEQLGVVERGGAIVWPCSDVQGRPLERLRILSGNGSKATQAPGRSPAPWWPLGRPDRASAVLVCEGESDALAAVCGLRNAPEAVASYQIVGMPGAASPTRRLAGDLLTAECNFAVIAADNDAGGAAFAERIEEALRPLGIEMARLPLTKADLADELAAGAELADLLVEAEAAPSAAPSEPEEEDWLAGAPMDPIATAVEPLPSVPGFPFLIPGAGAVIVGPTGGGRSSLVQAGLYDAARAGLRSAYLGHEVTREEFDARAALLARKRGHEVDDQLRADCARVRYLDLPATIMHAWESPAAWVEGVTRNYAVVVLDPLSAVESPLGLNFEQRNTEFVKFYDRLVQPLVARDVAVVVVDNVGHAIEAKSRAKGASAKSDRADLTFSCAIAANPPGLTVRAHKVRSIRSGIGRGDEWTFLRDTQTIERRDPEEARDDERREAILAALREHGPQSLNALSKSITGRRAALSATLHELDEAGLIERIGKAWQAVPDAGVPAGTAPDEEPPEAVPDGAHTRSEGPGGTAGVTAGSIGTDTSGNGLTSLSDRGEVMPF